MFKFISLSVGTCFILCTSLNAQLTPPTKKAITKDQSSEDSAEDKNKASSPRYETYYNAQGEKEVIAYKYGFQIKKEKNKDKKQGDSVQYEKTTSPSGETVTSAYKWGFQYKSDSNPAVKMSTPGTIKTPPPTSSNTGSRYSNDEEEDTPLPATTDASSGPNAEMRNKILEMIKAQKASQ